MCVWALRMQYQSVRLPSPDVVPLTIIPRSICPTARVHAKQPLGPPEGACYALAPTQWRCWGQCFDMSEALNWTQRAGAHPPSRFSPASLPRWPRATCTYMRAPLAAAAPPRAADTLLCLLRMFLLRKLGAKKALSTARASLCRQACMQRRRWRVSHPRDRRLRGPRATGHARAQAALGAAEPCALHAQGRRLAGAAAGGPGGGGGARSAARPRAAARGRVPAALQPAQHGLPALLRARRPAHCHGAPRHEKRHPLEGAAAARDQAARPLDARPMDACLHARRPEL